jgi:hypothetical protein
MKLCNTARARAARAVGVVAMASLPAALSLPFAGAAQAASLDVAHQTWSASITHTATPREGCFKATFPSLKWRQVVCGAAPKRLYVPRRGAAGQTVGNGNDYAAVSSTLTSAAVGTFPTVSDVTKETDDGEKNVYSLQLNSNFMSTAACNGSTTGDCLSWEQFVYSSSEEAAFMQYWLIDYGNKCPSGGGWNSYEGSCYKNSAAVTVPTIAITSLASFKLSGTAVSGGNDTLVFTDGTKAYSTSGKDSVVYLATAWDQSEFNVIGDGGGSEAKFNKGASITVNIALTDGSTAAPKCEADDGTTGETNNLNLGSCTASSGSSPSIKFTESD